MKTAINKNNIAAIRLLEKRKTAIKLLHKPGDRHRFAFWKRYNEPIYGYNGYEYTADLIRIFLDHRDFEVIDGYVYTMPAIHVLTVSGLYQMELETHTFSTDEDAENTFNQMVNQLDLKIV